MNKKLIFSFAAALIALLVFSIFAVIKKNNFVSRLDESKIISVSGLLQKASDSQKKGDLPEAKSFYQQLVSGFPESPEIANWQKKLEEINMQLLFSPALTSQSAIYQIKPTDTLAKIAKEFQTTAELIMKSNNLSSDKILPGRKLKVWTGGFNILVDKSLNVLLLKSGEEVIKTYIVSTGLNNSTPTGNFKIINKIVNPAWFKPGVVVPAGSPENILGSRWLGFDLTGYGIHGTTEPQNLGKQITEGCVRMANSDVEELYIIVPVGTEVTIVD